MEINDLYKTEKERIEELTNKLNKATKAYDEGNPAMSDEEFDSLYFLLEQLEHKINYQLPNSPTKVINYQVVNKLNKVEHNHPMLSLDKTKDITDVVKFLSGNDGIVMSKLDGLTCSLTYENGKLIAAETRGNGIIGEDILHNALVIFSIPNHIEAKEKVVIDGEIICNYFSFAEFAKEYKNPRNFAAGSIRLLDSKECERRNLSFVAWDIIEGYKDVKTLSEKMKVLLRNGFLTPVWFKCNSSEITQSLINDVKNESYSFGYPIDGLVFKIDNCEDYEKMGRTAHHFKGGLAYKFYDDLYDTTLNDIEWSMGRTGVLTPIAKFIPVDIDGTIVSRASLHNVSVMIDTLGNTPYKGQDIKIYKANLIIPQIAKGNKCNDVTDCFKNPTTCPHCGGALSKEENNNVITIRCNNRNCTGQFLNSAIHFCSKKGLDIKGLSESTLEKLIDWNWINSISDIFKLKGHKVEWVNKPGFGELSVNNILNAIEESRNCTFVNLLAALGIPLIGNTVAQEIAKKFNNSWTDYMNAINSNYDFSQWSGFGFSKMDSLLKYNYSEINNLINSGTIVVKSEELNTDVSNKCSSLVFCITGKLNNFKNRDELKAYIERQGGKVSSSVSKNTNYLINNDTTSTTAKNLTARNLGIPIISESEFLENF